MDILVEAGKIADSRASFPSPSETHDIGGMLAANPHTEQGRNFIASSIGTIGELNDSRAADEIRTEYLIAAGLE